VGNFWQTGAGAAHVFRRTGASWSQVQELEPPSGEAQEFGTSMAISGDTLVVGAPRQDQGSAYVYVLSGNTWTEQQRLTASDGETNDRFGDSVSVLGDAIVIGAPVGGNFVGSAYSFTRSGGTWHEEELFPAEVLTTAAQFGSSVAVAGAPGVLVGALEQDDSGAVYPLLMPPLPQVNYCTPGTSASGCQALLSATGNASASSPTGFTVQASAIEGSKDGVLFWGTNGRQAASWGNGTSYQCVVPPVTRAGPMVGVGTVGQCDGTFALDLNALWCPSCPKAHKNPGAGAVVQAQLWYRDPLNPSNQTTSLSDAIEFCVTP
jgi:hypothetical protein